MAEVRSVQVTSEQQMQQAITSYIAQGYTVMNQSPSQATLFKKKEFSILWLVIGLILCVVPLLVYLVIYAAQQDKMVEIRLVDSASLQLPQPGQGEAGQISPDGYWLWNGQEWVPNPGRPASTQAESEAPAPQPDEGTAGSGPGAGGTHSG